MEAEQHVISDNSNQRSQTAPPTTSAEQQMAPESNSNGPTSPDQKALCTPEKVDKIPRDESFQTCKATMPTPTTRRQLRSTPARNSILSGGKPYKEVSTSGKKFNSRKKTAARRAGADATGDRLNESADSNETYVRHERDLLYDPDSLDLNVSSHRRRQPLDLDDGINRPDISQFSASSPKKLSPTKKQQQQPEQKLDSVQPQPQPTPQQPTKRMSRQMPKPKPVPMPTSTPMPFAVPKAKPKPMPKPDQFYFNRYMSSTAKKPQQPSQHLQQQNQPTFKKPSSVISNFSVASSRRCLSQWNTPRLTRAQSFKSTAELEREYFSSLRSRF